LETITIASACNKLLRKRFLKPDTIGLIPTGGYSGNVNYSTKSLMWLVYREKNGRKILHCRNGREYGLPDIPRFNVIGFCPDSKSVYEFFGCYYHGYTCKSLREVSTVSPDTLADKYERTLTRIEQITRVGYRVEVEWDCDFDEKILTRHPELNTHPVVRHSPLNTRDALYGGRTEAMRLY